MKVRWFVTDFPFKPGITLINSRNLNRDQWSWLTVGEAPLWFDKRPYNGKWNKPAGLKPGHICHSEWFATGEPWPVSLPPTVFDADWIPACCERQNDPTAGGVQLGGAAGDILTTTDPTAGGVQLGGAGGDGIAFNDPTAGGVVLGGVAGDLLVTLDQTAGGMSVGGAAGDGIETNDPAAGGVEVGGEAGDVFTPAAPTPGTDCASAPLMDEGVLYEYTGPGSFGASQWFRWELSPSTAYHLTVADLSVFTNANLFSGASCAGLSGIGSGNNGCIDFTTGASGIVWVQFLFMLDTTETYTFIIESGAC